MVWYVHKVRLGRDYRIYKIENLQSNTEETWPCFLQVEIINHLVNNSSHSQEQGSKITKIDNLHLSLKISAKYRQKKVTTIVVRDILMLNRMGSGCPDGQVRGTVFHRRDTCPDFGYRL